MREQTSSTKWNPGQYLRYKNERTRPARDLAARLEGVRPRRVLDIGCGPGNSTALLRERWPEAEVVGLDSSEEMIARAKADWPAGTWLVRDAAEDLGDLGRFEVVFSNAALQWMPDHARLLPALFALVAPGGVLAVQIPNCGQAPLHQALDRLVAGDKWGGRFPADPARLYFPPGEYYDLVGKLTPEAELWETIYYHVLDGLDEIIEWYRGSSLRHYLAALDSEAERRDFETDLRERIADAYHVRPDGKMLFPFRRLFFIARAPS